MPTLAFVCAAPSAPKILIVDVSLPAEAAPRLKKERSGLTIETNNIKAPVHLDAKSCSASLMLVENYFEAQLGKGPQGFQLKESDAEKLQTAIGASHGMHTLGLVTRNLKHAKIYTIGLSRTEGSELKNTAQYIKQIETNMSEIRKVIANQKIDLVNLSASESIEENTADLRGAGLDADDARKRASQIVSTWEVEWTKTLSQFPETLFIVAAGNGGVEGTGINFDQVKDSAKLPLPARLQTPNMVVVASSPKSILPDSENCLSHFSNYGASLAQITVGGEEVESWAPCTSKPTLKLTGTSQSTALVTNLLARAMEEGKNPYQVLLSARSFKCMTGKVKLGTFLE